MSATSPTAPRSRPLTLDDVILLNDEIRGLIAAGIPLDIGLSGLASRVPGRLKKLSERLAKRLDAGEPLEAALRAESGALPGEYQVVVAAGLRSGRFDEALGSMARYAAELRELRAGLRRALIYPGVVCGLAFGLLVAVFVFVVPLLLSNSDAMQLPRNEWHQWLETLHRSVGYWGIGIPAAVLLVSVLPTIARSLRRDIDQSGPTTQLYLAGFRWVPGVRGALRAAQWSRFAHLLSVLIEAGVPFDEAARLSAAAVGDRRVVDAIRSAEAGVKQGESLGEALDRDRRIPPLLRWMMKWGERDSSLAATLREASAQFAQRALIRAEFVQRFVPLSVVVLVGGSLALAYSLTVIVPLTSLWEGLASSY